jgi:hypothetical protein
LEKYRPKIVLIENHEYKSEADQAPIRDFMAVQDYRFAFRTVNTDFFVNNEQIKV